MGNEEPIMNKTTLVLAPIIIIYSFTNDGLCKSGMFAKNDRIYGLDSLGWKWARDAYASGGGLPWKVAVDSSGNVYTIGYYGGSLTFGGIAINATGSWSVFVCKYDPNGNVLWAKNYADNLAEGIGIAIDRYNNFYMTGYYEGTSSFGSFSVSSAGDRDIFIAKCDS